MNSKEYPMVVAQERGFQYGRSLLYTIFRHGAGLGERTAMERAERISRRARGLEPEALALPA